jgi:hypothetical protein
VVSPMNQSSRRTCVRRTACASAAFAALAAGAALATAGRASHLHSRPCVHGHRAGQTLSLVPGTNVRGVRRCAAFATSETVGLGFDPEAPPWPNTGLYIARQSGFGRPTSRHRIVAKPFVSKPVLR